VHSWSAGGAKLVGFVGCAIFQRAGDIFIYLEIKIEEFGGG
jgi:hypothetical protein